MPRLLLRRVVGGVVLVALVLLVATAQKPPIRVAASLDPSDSTQIRFEGELKSRSLNLWSIGEYNVQVDAQTIIVEKRGPAEVGAWLIVWANQLPAGGLRAEVISVDRPAGQANPTIQFTRVLDKITEQWWVLGDLLVHVRPETPISGSPTIGSLVRVTAEQQELTLEAVRLEVLAQSADEIPVEFEGIVEELGPEYWTVQGQRFTVTPDTEIQGQPAVGQYVEVRALRTADGSLVAARIAIPNRAAERTMGAVVAAIVPQDEDSQVWDMLVFPDQLWADPYSAAVHVDGNTIVDESRAIAQAGQWTDVRARALGPSEYAAEVIRVEQPISVTLEADVQSASAAVPARAASASGTAGGTWWQVNGRPVWVPGQATMTAAARAASGKVTIEGVLLGNGVIWAKRILW